MSVRYFLHRVLHIDYGEPGGVAVKTSEFVIQGRGFESDDRHYYISLSYLGGVREGHPATKSPASADPSYLHRGIPVAPGPARPHRGSSTLKWNFLITVKTVNL